MGFITNAAGGQMYLKSNSNLGIYEASPETRVHITGAGGGGESALMLEDSTGGSNTKKFRMYVNNNLGYIDAPNDAFSSAVDIVNCNLSNADVTVTTGNLVIGTSGKGIDFTAEAASTESGTDRSSSILDDYEEGTWTAVVSDGTNAMTLNGTYDTGYYTKIGNVVTISGYFVTTSAGSCQW